jgi:hypothetical protein
VVGDAAGNAVLGDRATVGAEDVKCGWAVAAGVATPLRAGLAAASIAVASADGVGRAVGVSAAASVGSGDVGGGGIIVSSERSGTWIGLAACALVRMAARWTCDGRSNAVTARTAPRLNPKTSIRISAIVTPTTTGRPSFPGSSIMLVPQMPGCRRSS